jgi:hypothetical protein
MKIQQLSVFVENKPGHLARPCVVLAEAGINLLTLSLADTEQFGILRLIVRDWQRARDVLTQAGFTVTANEVLAIEVPDRPGGLAELLKLLERAQVNVEYMYAFTASIGTRAVLVFRFEDADAAMAVLTAGGVNVLSQVQEY